jgi:hypothetical protein
MMSFMAADATTAHDLLEREQELERVDALLRRARDEAEGRWRSRDRQGSARRACCGRRPSTRAPRG